MARRNKPSTTDALLVRLLSGADPKTLLIQAAYSTV